jgi:hypothetical protein
MLVTTVESTTLRTVAYDEAREVLQLEFCNRAIYQYFDVPAAVHQALLDAQSKGGYFNRVIRRDFRYCQVPDFNQQRPSGFAVARRPR